MAFVNLRQEEKIGLAVAVALHVALIGVLLLRPHIVPPPLPQRISVTLSPDAGLNATAPTHDDAAADIAPTLGSPPPAAAPAPVVSPQPAKVTAPPVAKTLPEPKPVAVTRARPEAVQPPAPVARPAAPAAKPAHKLISSERDRS